MSNLRNNLGSIYSSNISNKYNSKSIKYGRVFHVIIDENSLGYTDESSIGTVFYEYDLNIYNKDENELTINDLKNPSFPLFPFISYIPLIGEIITIIDLPSDMSSENKDHLIQYYISPINIFNNTHHNSQGKNNINNDIILGNYINEREDIKILKPFEGDLILRGRWNNNIRFGSTLGINANENFWSNGTGKNGDPILLISNGNKGNIEDINNDLSSIYLTSTQQISNFTSSFNLSSNPFVKFIDNNIYGNNSQIILNSNKILINSNKHDIILNAKENIGIGANNIIIEASKIIHIFSNMVILGSVNNDKYIDDIEPLVKGFKTKQLLTELISCLINLTSDLSNQNSIRSTPNGTPIMGIISTAGLTNEKLKKLNKQLDKILSQKTFTS
jgi:hypothetical protein